MRLSVFYATLLATLLLISSASAASAASVVSWTNEADAVCVAVCDAQQATPEIFMYDANAAYRTQTNSFHVLSSLKGIKQTEIVVKTHSLDIHSLIAKGITTFSYPEYYSSFQVHRNYLLFLKKDAHSETYSLVSPYDKAQSAILLDKLYSGNANSASPLVQSLLHLVPSLSSADESVKLNVIDFAGEYGEVLEQRDFYSKADISLSPEAAKERQELSSVVSAQVEPVLMNISRTGSEAEKANSLAALAKLQVVSAIPSLVGLASSGSSFSKMAALALGDYRTNAAAPLLAPLVIGHQSSLEEAASYSLQTLSDPASIPFLIKALDDPDISVRYNAVSALYRITGEMSPVAYAMYPSKEAEYKKFWKNWKPALTAGAKNPK